MERRTEDRWNLDEDTPIVTFDFWEFLKALTYTLTGLGIGYYLWG